MEWLETKRQKAFIGDEDQTTETSTEELGGHSCKSDGTAAAFEVRDIGQLGAAVFAMKDILAGSCFLSEEPLFVIPKRRAMILPPDISKAYREASKESQDHFDRLRSRLDVPDRYDAQLAKVAKISPELVQVLKFQFNSGECSSGTAIYNTVCRFNHSCTPNVHKENFDTDEISCFALRDIKNGEELTAAYRPEVFYMTTAERQEGFPRMKQPFLCQCRLCTAPPEDRLVSDLRRHLMRYLYTCIYRQDPAPTLAELDTQLVRERILAQTSSWMSSARDTILVYLLATLADLEGVGAICDSARDYAMAAAALIDLHKDEGLNRLTAPSYRNFLRWVARSKELRDATSSIMEEQTKQ